MIPQKIAIPAVVVGHTWPGITSIRRVDRPSSGGDPAPPASPLATAEMAFGSSLQACEAAPALLLTSAGDDPTISIDDAAEWEFSIPKIILPLAAGRWNFLITTIAGDGTRDPLLTGILEVRNLI
jgi:hypothetical protein